MEFTYKSYCALLSLLCQCGYGIVDYTDWEKTERCVILRHDIDCDMAKAVQMARIEQEFGVASTYFVLVTSDFYNIFSADNRRKLQEIVKRGHRIGLHFDETAYDLAAGGLDMLREKVAYEADLLEKVLDMPVQVVSMHRPSQMMLNGKAKLNLPGLMNAYETPFFDEFKYLSDSRRRWREPAEEIIASKKYDKLQLLTHPFWYHEEEINMHDAIVNFVGRANKERYAALNDNFTDLPSVLGADEI